MFQSFEMRIILLLQLSDRWALTMRALAESDVADSWLITARTTKASLYR